MLRLDAHDAGGDRAGVLVGVRRRCWRRRSAPRRPRARWRARRPRPGPVSDGLALFTTPSSTGSGWSCALPPKPGDRGVERLGVLLVLLLGLLHERLDHRVGAGAADEVERERGVVGGDGEVLDRRRGLQHLHVHRLVGERRRRRATRPSRCRGRRRRARPTSGGHRAAVVRRRRPGSTSCPRIVVRELDVLVECDARRLHRVGVQVVRLLEQVAQPRVVECHAFSPRSRGELARCSCAVAVRRGCAVADRAALDECRTRRHVSHGQAMSPTASGAL